MSATTGRMRNEAGGALLVAMVMIFMLSLMGISAMRGSTLEHQMASNSVQAATTFQAAESSTDLILNDPGNLRDVWHSAARSESFDTNLKQDIDGLSSQVTLRYVGDVTALGASMGVGKRNFTALQFEAEGSASIDSVRARATVLQGAYQKAPKQ